LIGYVPVPFGSSLLATLTGWTVSKIADKGLSTMLPGDYTLINILIELSKGTMNMKHFQNPNFYLKIDDRKNKNEYEPIIVDTIENPKSGSCCCGFCCCGCCCGESKKKSKVSEIPKGSKFSLSYENNYVTQRIEYHKRDLNPNSNMENNDHCLELLFKIKGEKFLYFY
jgi:hypothetical protein